MGGNIYLATAMLQYFLCSAILFSFAVLSYEGTPKAYLIFIEEEKKVIYKKPGVLQAVTLAHTSHTR
jgi:hypothetical protein